MGAINIAVIISGIDEEYQSTILDGVHEYARENNINIVHFIAFGGVLGSEKNDVGEFNIYNLINYDLMDGAILLTNTIASPEITQKIIKELKESNIPASSVDFDIPGLFHVGINNEDAMADVVRHVVEHHKVRSTNFISGPDENPENIMRFNAYKKVLAENNITVDEDKIYHGSFRERDGRAAVEKFISEGKLTKALICANDAMAMGAIATLEELGYRVPEDVIVTGFDNVYNARNYHPKVTSVDRPLKQSGYIACQQVHNEIMNVEQERSIILETKVVKSASCGCSDTTCDDFIKFKKDTYQTMEIYHHDVPNINQMSCDLQESEDFDQFIKNLKPYIEMIKCEKFYLCLCDDWLGDESTDTRFSRYLTKGYTDNVQVPLVYCDDAFGKLEEFPSRYMLPDMHSSSDESKRYFFSPLHFNDRCLGYAIICNSVFPLKSPLFHTWVMTISNAIENIRKHTCIERTMKKLEMLYVIDPLSGIFNRNGFHENTAKLYQECIEQKRNIMIMFADMDGMKYINDNFGHKEGDSAIKSMAMAVQDACVEDEICARFGGDEFIIFGADHTEEMAQKIMKRINSNIATYNQRSGKPYNIEISIGWHIEVPEEETKLNALITKADQKMYREKKRKPNRRK
ncbi:MAG: GGDEF domain-containing protein [Ruminococcus sp.]|nr:GGDEF domain-containing protein [Ruminococcus sp.]